MKKTLFLLLFTVLSLSSPLQTYAQEFRKDENITVGEDETITQDFFAVGRNIIVSGNIEGDAYLAGENILVDGKVFGDLILAGKRITIEGDIEGNLRAVGQELIIYGSIQKNATWIGESASISPPSSIEGSLTSVSKELALNMPLGRGATLTGENITIDSQINGNLLAAAGERLFLDENARIEGDVNYYTRTGLVMTQSPTASISGETTHNIYVTDKEMHFDPSPVLGGIYLFFKVLGLLSILLVGIILTIFIPRYAENVTKQIDFHPLKSFLLGILTAILAPVVIIFLFVTLIGIPFAILLIPLYLALLFFGSVFTIFFIGQKIMIYLDRKKSSPLVKFLVGFLVFAALTFVPIFGHLLGMIATILGSGALILEKKRLFRKLQE